MSLATQEVTLPSGREVLMRERLPAHVLLRRAEREGDEDVVQMLMGLANGGEAAQAAVGMRLTDLIVSSVVIRPRIVFEGEAVTGDDPDDPSEIHIDELDQEDYDRIAEVAMEGLTHAARFQRERDGDDGGPDGEGVGSKAKRPAGTKRKPRGAAARS